MRRTQATFHVSVLCRSAMHHEQQDEKIQLLSSCVVEEAGDKWQCDNGELAGGWGMADNQIGKKINK